MPYINILGIMLTILHNISFCLSFSTIFQDVGVLFVSKAQNVVPQEILQNLIDR